MATKTYVLVDKATDKAIYGGQHFTFDDADRSSPVGLLGGPGQQDWYWCEITDKSQAIRDAIAEGTKSMRTPPGGERIPAFSVDADGTETGKNHTVSGGTWA